MRHVMDELNHHAYAADLELFEQFQRDAAETGPWADAFPYSRGTIRLTLPELGAFFEEHIALLNRYKRPEAETPAGARHRTHPGSRLPGTPHRSRSRSRSRPGARRKRDRALS
jgi:hypothetical protein